MSFPSYTYQGVEPGFAEHDLDEYNNVAAGLAWTRTIGLLRRAFKIETELEKVREEHLALQFGGKDATNAAKVMANMTEDPYVNNVPTMTGGVGHKDLFLFYRDYFIPKNPPSLRMKLVSRTVGVDRVVDEMVVSFTHDDEVDWILPGVPPTGKRVEVAVVSIVTVRGGKLVSEHMYWDQASVLMQAGLLDSMPRYTRTQSTSAAAKHVPRPLAMAAMDPSQVRRDETSTEAKTRSGL